MKELEAEQPVTQEKFHGSEHSGSQVKIVF